MEVKRIRILANPGSGVDFVTPGTIAAGWCSFVVRYFPQSGRGFAFLSARQPDPYLEEKVGY